MAVLTLSMLNFYWMVVTIVQPTYIWSICSSILGDKTTSNQLCQLCYGKLAETLAVSKFLGLSKPWFKISPWNIRHGLEECYIMLWLWTSHTMFLGLFIIRRHEHPMKMSWAELNAIFWGSPAISVTGETYTAWTKSWMPRTLRGPTMVQNVQNTTGMQDRSRKKRYLRYHHLVSFGQS